MTLSEELESLFCSLYEGMYTQHRSFYAFFDLVYTHGSQGVYH